MGNSFKVESKLWWKLKPKFFVIYLIMGVWNCVRHRRRDANGLCGVVKDYFRLSLGVVSRRLSSDVRVDGRCLDRSLVLRIRVCLVIRGRRCVRSRDLWRLVSGVGHDRVGWSVGGCRCGRHDGGLLGHVPGGRLGGCGCCIRDLKQIWNGFLLQ
jgi:hypothetical protein